MDGPSGRSKRNNACVEDVWNYWNGQTFLIKDSVLYAVHDTHRMALQDTVQRAAAFNRSLTRRAEAARVISPAAALQEPLPSSAPAGGPFSAEQPTTQQQGANSEAEPDQADTSGPSSAAARGSFSGEQAATQQLDSEAEPDQADAAAPEQEQLPVSLPAVPEEERAAGSPDQGAQGQAGGDEKVTGADGVESRHGDADVKAVASEVPSTLEPDEAPHEPASETVALDATEHAQESDQTASSTVELERQEQAGTHDTQQEPSSTVEQPDIKTGSSAKAPEQASTPRAARGLTQDAEQAEQLLPALMRQVLLCCSISPPQHVPCLRTPMA